MASQLGLITRAQAMALGVDDAAISRCLAMERWVRALPRVYRGSEAPESHDQRVLSVQLWGGDTCALSHRSSGYLLGILKEAPAKVDLTIEGNQSAPARWIRIHRSIDYCPDALTTIGLFRVVGVERTLVDLAAVVTPHALERALDQALGKGLTSIDRITRKAGALMGRGRRGTKLLKALIEERARGIGITGSDLEIMFLEDVVRGGHLPKPVRQFTLHDQKGFIGRFDFFFKGGNLIVETDGFKDHGRREIWIEDRRRDRRAMALGYRVVRFSWWDLTSDPDEVIASLRVLLSLPPL